MTSGKLIVGVGLPGSGKTSLFSELSNLTNGKSWLEPEERLWDKSVRQRDEYGHIGGLHWFRSQRVPNLFEARKSADSGEISLLDTFYDKICSFYLGKPGMEWLISPSDPYFDNFKRTAELDLEHLPDADVVVAIEVTKDDWIKMVGSRGRQLDSMVKLTETFHTQELFLNAASLYCKSRNAKLIRFRNVYSTVSESTELLRNTLKSNGIEI